MTTKRLLKVVLYLIIAGIVVSTAAAWIAYRSIDRSPGDLLRYAERRLTGHPKLEFFALPVIRHLRASIERPVANDFAVPTMGKGAQAHSLPPQQYDTTGMPLPTSATDLALSTAAPGMLVRVSSGEALQRAMEDAMPGTTIEILPGTYPHLNDFKTHRPGTAIAPIRVMARQPGTAVLELEGGEGFRVSHSYWQFENLDLRGSCKEDASCEHAFHIYGAARSVVVRNNRITNFNAHIKVNGLDGRWPDFGLLQYNTMSNTAPRRTSQPTTPFDLVGANGWIVADNIVTNFVKLEGNQVSYGIFMKGGGSEGRIERNLLVCSLRDISMSGVRVGISMGGGTTGQEVCRNKQCATEHTQGVVANNIVAHCNDAGIDVNRSNQILISHNTLINTAGISLRDPISSAYIASNVLEGEIHARDGALTDVRHNLIGKLKSRFVDPDRLDLQWRDTPAGVQKELRTGEDFCRRKRAATTLPGAFDHTQACTPANATQASPI